MAHTRSTQLFIIARTLNTFGVQLPANKNNQSYRGSTRGSEIRGMTVSVKIRGSTSIFMRWHRITSSTLLTGQQIVTVVRTGVPDDHLCHVSNILPNGNNVLRGRQVVRLHYLCIMKISVSYAFLHRYAFASKVAAVTERGIIVSRCRPSDI